MIAWCSIRARQRLPAMKAWLSKHAADVALLVVTLALAYAVKRHFSGADADDLAWILAPTAWLTGSLLGYDFVRLPDAGYLSQELSILVAPACAGVNFFVVVFVVSSFGFGRRFGSLARRALWLVGSAVAAYGAAIVVNATRIALSVHVAHDASRRFELTFQEAHRLLGIATYLGGLIAIVVVTEAAFARARAPRPRTPTGGARTFGFALLAYLGVTLIVPLVRGAARNPSFWEHSLAVGGATLVLGGIGFALSAWVSRSRATGDGRRAPRTKTPEGLTLPQSSCPHCS